MITAIILLNTRHDAINEVGQKLAAISGVSEVYSVSGRFDLVAILRVENIDAMALLSTEKLAGIDGITHTESMVAFKKISPEDMAGLFDLGN